MATPIGLNSVSSLARRFIMPWVVDNVYRSNALYFRLNAMNKKTLTGGYQIEVPVIWSHMAAGGFYSGFDLLDVSPSDTVKNAAFDWKEAYVPITIDGGTLIRTDGVDVVVNMLRQQFAQGQMELKEILGQGMWGNSNLNPKSIDGIQVAVDNGAVAPVYGGLSRSANTFWNAQVATASAPLTFPQLQTVFANCTEGGQRPTIGFTTTAVYNILWALSTGVNSTSGVPGQSFPVQAGGEDQQLAQAGFSNILFNGVPIIIDSHCPAGSLYFLNEEFFTLYVQTQRDVYMKDFQSPVNQDAFTSLILWAGNLICSNVQRQGVLKGITA